MPRGGVRRNGTVYLLRLPEKTRAGQVDACTWTHDARRTTHGAKTRIRTVSQHAYTYIGVVYIQHTYIRVI